MQHSGDAFAIGVHESGRQAKEVPSPCLILNQPKASPPGPGSSVVHHLRCLVVQLASARRLSQPGQPLMASPKNKTAHQYLISTKKPTRDERGGCARPGFSCAIPRPQAKRAWQPGSYAGRIRPISSNRRVSWCCPSVSNTELVAQPRWLRREGKKSNGILTARARRAPLPPRP